MPRGSLMAVILAWSFSLPAAAQPVDEPTGDVGLVADAESVDTAFLQFVQVPVERRYDEMDAARGDHAVAFVVDLRGSDGLVRIWRRSDRATLERRLEEPDPEGYALAVMGSELLEVARAGSMEEVVSVDPPAPEVAPGDPTAESAQGEADRAPDESDPVEANPPGDRVAFTVGAAFEAWFSPDANGPWQLQPALALELAWSPAGEDWQLGVGLFGAGLGQFDRPLGGLEGHYNRYDGGLRLTVGGAVGPARTRLLGHVRVGASAVVGRAEDNSVANGEEGSATVAAFFVGPSFEVRQPVLEGLEITAEIGLDGLVEPVAFTAAGTPLLVESPVRLGARLGLAYRVE